MTYADYKARFYETVPLLPLPTDALVGLPLFVSSVPNVWHFEWEVEFTSDAHYIYCREGWSARRSHPAKRFMFSLHYGPGPKRDPNGKIDYGKADPVVLRFDKTGRFPEHVHYGAPLPHYEQSRVTGLIIDTIDLYKFVQSVLQYRSTKVPLDQILGFKVA